MKIKPEGLPQSVIDRLQDLADRYPHAEIELEPDTTELSEDDLQAIEGFIRLDAGEGVDADEMIAKARAVVARARQRFAHLILSAEIDDDDLPRRQPARVIKKLEDE